MELNEKSGELIIKHIGDVNIEDADLLIQPDLSNFNRSDMGQIEESMKKGYEDSINILKK